VTDDQRLVAAALAGSAQAGEELFARHWLAAWRVALSVSGSPAAADDIAQDAFERAFRGLGGLDRFAEAKSRSGGPAFGNVTRVRCASRGRCASRDSQPHSEWQCAVTGLWDTEDEP
jgi:hypothetical protein